MPSYRGLHIDLTAGMHFAVEDKRKDIKEDDRYEINGTYETYQKACEAVDRAIRKRETLLSKTLPTREVLDPRGTLLVMHGIHKARGIPLYRPPCDDSETFPNVSWVKQLLDERVGLDKRRKEISDTLQKVRIYNTAYRWEDMSESYEKFVKLIDEKTEQARKMGGPALVSDTKRA